MGQNVPVKDQAKYLGVWIDKYLSLNTQINHVCSQGYNSIRNLWKITSKLNDIKVKTQLVHTCILSKINFCSSLYKFTTKKNQYKLSKLINAGVRFIYRIIGKARQNPITPFLQELHFLPILYRAEFKINLLTYKCFNNAAPQYLKDLLIPRAILPLKNTRKIDDLTYLSSHPMEKLNYKNQCFRQIAPKLWNNLDQEIRESTNVNVYKSKLKTYYFELWISEN